MTKTNIIWMWISFGCCLVIFFQGREVFAGLLWTATMLELIRQELVKLNNNKK